MSRQNQAISLDIRPLSTHFHGSTIGTQHRKMLMEKKLEYQDLIRRRKQDFDTEAEKLINKLTLTDAFQNEAYRKLRATQQNHLEDLHNKCQERLDQLLHTYQREWIETPTEDEPVGYNGSEHGTYIANTVGKALELGLTEVCLHQPEDPIEFLANWLRKYAQTVARRKGEAVRALELQKAAEEQSLVGSQEKTLQNEVLHIAQEEHRRKEEYLKVKTVLETSQLKDNAQSKLDSIETQSTERPSLSLTISDPSNQDSEDVIVPSPDPQLDESGDSGGMAVLYTIHEKTTEEHDA